MPYDYSSITYSNVSIDALRKMMSNAAIRPNQGGSFAAGTIRVPVARTALITTGTINGNTSTGNNNSRAWVAAAIAENSVPTAAMPNVPSRTMGSNAPNNGTSNSAAKIGNATISTTPINSKLPSSFAR